MTFLNKIFFGFTIFFIVNFCYSYTEIEVGTINNQPGLSTYQPLVWNDGTNIRSIDIDVTNSGAKIINLRDQNLNILSTGSLNLAGSDWEIYQINSKGEFFYFQQKFKIIQIKIRTLTNTFSNQYAIVTNNTIYVYNSSQIQYDYIRGIIGNRIYLLVDNTFPFNNYVYFDMSSLSFITGQSSSLYPCSKYDAYNILYHFQDTTTTQNILYDNQYYYLLTYNGTSCSVNRIFTNSIIGGELEKLNLDNKFLQNKRAKFYTIDINGIRNYWLSLCNTTAYTGITIPNSTGSINSFNVTLFGQLDLSQSSPTGLYTLEGKYYDYVYNGTWLKYLNNNQIINRGGECTTNYGYGGFINNSPSRVYYYYRSGGSSFKLYYAALTNQEIEIIGGDTTLGGSGALFNPDSEIPPDDILRELWNIDRDGDGEISIPEALLAPFTIIQNIVQRVYATWLNIWEILKILLDIGNMSFINKTYAADFDGNIIGSLTENTEKIVKGETETMQGWSSLISKGKYMILFLIFMAIILLIVSYKIKE